MTTRAQLEKKLVKEADKLKLSPQKRFGYIYGTLNKQFPIKRKKNPVVKAKSKIVARAAKRRKNPVVPATRQTQIEHAMKLYKRFRLDDPEFVDEVDHPHVEVAMVIGECDGVLYTTIRNGRKEEYIHEFAKKSKPLLVASWDGKQVLLVGGKYNFTEQGITDY